MDEVATTEEDAVAAVTGITDYLMDKINTEIAPDFVLRDGHNRLLYFDMEAADVFVLTVQRGKVVIA